MAIDALYQLSKPPASETVTITFEGRAIEVPAGISVAAALLVGGVDNFRSSVVAGTPRGPYCMMGVCFECLVEIDGVPARQSCLVPVRDGMAVARQVGAAALSFDDGE